MVGEEAHPPPVGDGCKGHRMESGNATTTVGCIQSWVEGTGNDRDGGDDETLREISALRGAEDAK